jgi:hypothetical protein
MTHVEVAQQCVSVSAPASALLHPCSERQDTGDGSSHGSFGLLLGVDKMFLLDGQQVLINELDDRLAMRLACSHDLVLPLVKTHFGGASIALHLDIETRPPFRRSKRVMLTCSCSLMCSSFSSPTWNHSSESLATVGIAQHRVGTSQIGAERRAEELGGYNPLHAKL